MTQSDSNEEPGQPSELDSDADEDEEEDDRAFSRPVNGDGRQKDGRTQYDRLLYGSIRPSQDC